METKIELIISGISLLFSGMAFYYAYSAYRRTHFGLLSIEATHSHPNESIIVSIINTGSRPITVSELKLGYGHNPNAMDTILNLDEELDKSLLRVGEQRSHKIAVNDIQTAAKSLTVTQGRYRRLWVKAKIAGGNYVNEMVCLDLSVLKDGVLESAIHFIATDMVMGFESLDPEIFPIGQNK